MKRDTSEIEKPNQTQTLVLLVATALGIYLCYRLVAPFLAPIAWALALAVLFTPLQNWLEVKLKRPNLAASGAVLLIVLVVVIPATFVTQSLVRQAAYGVSTIQLKINSGEWRRLLAAQPRLASLAEKVESGVDLPGTINSVAGRLSTTAGTIISGSVFQLLEIFFTFYLLFFFLRDRKTALEFIRAHSPLSDIEMDGMFVRISDTIFATIYGTLAVALVQGVLGGLMFWWLGLPAPLLWGLVMGLLAIVPVLGAFVVWIPASLFLTLEGSWGRAIILSLWGLFGIGTIDNFLYPAIVGNRLKLHTVIAFLSVVGGLLVFGAAGLILGPLVIAITTVLLEIWSNRSKETTTLMQQ